MRVKVDVMENEKILTLATQQAMFRSKTTKIFCIVTITSNLWTHA
jgi:hypothetical protein